MGSVLSASSTCPEPVTDASKFREHLLALRPEPSAESNCRQHPRRVGTSFGRATAESLHEIDVDGAAHVVWHCRQKAGLGAVLLSYLGLADKASKQFAGVHLDAREMFYGDISWIFPLQDRIVHVLSEIHSKGKDATSSSVSSSSFKKWQSFARGAACRDDKPLLSSTDANEGRNLCRNYLRIHGSVIQLLEAATSTMGLSEALGVHIRRTDKVSEAPSNLQVGLEEVVSKVLRTARSLQVTRIFLAGDDAAFLAELQTQLKAASEMILVSWPSRLSIRCRAVHYDSEIPGFEAASDALADSFCLSRCRGLLCSFSCLSVLAVLLAPGPDYPLYHFRYPQLQQDPWENDAFPT